MPKTHTSQQKHTKQHSPKLLRISSETHRSLKWVAAQRCLTMADCVARLIDRAMDRELQKLERQVLKRREQPANQPTAKVA